MLTLQQVLCLYQELVPSLLADNPNHISNILEVFRRVTDSADAQLEEDLIPQLYLLKLLSGTDARQLPWGKEVGF